MQMLYNGTIGIQAQQPQLQTNLIPHQVIVQQVPQYQNMQIQNVQPTKPVERVQPIQTGQNLIQLPVGTRPIPTTVNSSAVQPLL